MAVKSTLFQADLSAGKSSCLRNKPLLCMSISFCPDLSCCMTHGPSSHQNSFQLYARHGPISLV